MFLEDFSSGLESMYVSGTKMETSHTHMIFNYTAPSSYVYISLNRMVVLADVRKQKLDKMPGFRVTWNYSGMEVEPMAKYHNNIMTKAFVRSGGFINSK